MIDITEHDFADLEVQADRRRGHNIRTTSTGKSILAHGKEIARFQTVGRKFFRIIPRANDLPPASGVQRVKR